MNEDELAKLLHGEDRAGGPSAGDVAARRTARTLRELLTREAVWAEPRPGGVDAVLTAISYEAEHGRPALAAVDDEPHGEPAWQGELYELPGRRSPDAPSQHGRRRRTLALVSAAAAVVVVATAVGLLLAIDGGGDSDGAEVAGPEFTINGTELEPDAVAVAQMDDPGAGLVIRLQVQGLDPAEPGTYYQGWLAGPSGKVAVGTFHMREGDGNVWLWSGVYPDEGYPTLVITREVQGPDAGASGQVVLSGQLGP